MPIEGELTLRIDWNGHRIERVAVHSTRPFVARRVLVGKPIADAIATVPLLFGICRRAQSAAAAGALEAADARRGDANRRAARVSVLLETLQEHVSHLLIDLPRAMRLEPAIVSAANVRKRSEALLQTIERDAGRIEPALLRDVVSIAEATAASEIYGMSSARWINLGDFNDLLIWAGHGATLPARILNDVLRDTPTLGVSDVALMPPTLRDALLSIVAPAMVRDRDFDRAPTWRGLPVETGPLARMHEHRLVAPVARHCGHGVAARLVARLVELALLLRDVQGPNSSADEPAPMQTFSVASGEGMAAVQTARGVLLHRARIADGRVADYQIVAPTEWNCHPDGALVRGIARMAASDRTEVERRATLVTQVFDPCVAFRVEVGHA